MHITFCSAIIKYAHSPAVQALRHAILFNEPSHAGFILVSLRLGQKCGITKVPQVQETRRVQ